jgi:hypothetical protein
MDERFAELAQKERGMTRKSWTRLEQQAAEMVRAAAQDGKESE